MTTKKDFSSYTYGEGRTGIGQLVTFSCRIDTAQKVKEFLQEYVREIDIPTTGRINIQHGGYGRYTRYTIVQHDYAGGGHGYIEVLEIKNPPDTRCGIVIFDSCRGKYGGYFTEWETIEQAREAFQQFWGSHGQTEEEQKKHPGFKRYVDCGMLTPWFYAIGEEQLVGDYTFPSNLNDDVVYRFGRQFVVFDGDGIPAIKTCMGTRMLESKSNFTPETHTYRRVSWDDGSVWNEWSEFSSHRRQPIPADESDVWIAEAVQQFQKLLAGKSAEFTINFTDGNKFVGKVVRTNHKTPCAAGDYLLIVKVKGEEKPREGWLRDFSPTPEAPDPIQLARIKLAEKGLELEFVEIKKVKTELGGKKWAGVFYQRTL